jgi:ADP-ribose pyrophosphatase YjhB (NUDIX family)
MADPQEPQRLPRVGAATFVVKGTEILLGRSKKHPGPLGDRIVIPGGGVRPFEGVNDAARREILEETGVACLVDDILFVSEVVKPPYEHRIVLYMMGQFLAYADETKGLVASDDLSEVFWCDTRKLGDYQDDMTEMTVDAICKFSVALRSRSMTRRDL